MPIAVNRMRDFLYQKGSLLMDTISCVSLFLERQANVLFIGVFNALIHEQFLYIDKFTEILTLKASE